MATLFDRRTAIGLPAPEPAVEPATTVPALIAASSWASGGSTWSSGSAVPSDGAVCGVTTTTRVAWEAGCPVVLRKPDVAYAASIVCASVSRSLPVDGELAEEELADGELADEAPADGAPPDPAVVDFSDLTRISLAITCAACCW